MPTDEYCIPPDAITHLPEVLNSKTVLTTAKAESLHQPNGHFQYCGVRIMELTDSDRPISYSSTSSSTSSRDSHCSFGSRMTLSSNNHLGLFNQDKEAGAIKLELTPARHLVDNEHWRGSSCDRRNSVPASEKRLSTIKRVECKGPCKNSALSSVKEPGSPKLSYVDRVVQEILQTERTYVQDLKSIVQDYLECITDQSRLLLGTEERSALFGNIRDIYHFNSDLLQELENCDNDPVAIAECFVAKSEEFHIYTQYCTNYPRSVAVLTECMRNKALVKFFRERQEALKHSLPLGSYLLKPVQRILKYHLLLQEISNHLDKETDGYEVVLDAIDTMQRVAWHINDMKRKHEHAIRLQEVQSLLSNWKGPDLTSYGELVLEGTFRIQRAKTERTLFLLDKLLLITKKREEMYTYKAHILCCNLMLVEVIPKEPLSFSVFHYKNCKVQHTVQAKSQQEKRLWILHLKRLILENHPAKIPAKAKQAILEMDAANHPGFHFSPEGDIKTVANAKGSGSSPRRLRRKSEPSARLHKALKQNEGSPDMKKRISIEGTLLAQAAKLGSSEGILSSHSNQNALHHSSLVNQSQESLEPSYHSDLEESLQLQNMEHTDTEDDEEALQLQTKGCRKRLNSRGSQNIEKRRSLNLSTGTTQSSGEPSAEESSQVGTDSVTSRSSEQHSKHSEGRHVLRRIAALRSIWTDHQIRQALFPRRHFPRQNEDEDDDYQMFMPTEASSNFDLSRLRDEDGSSSRPCSWHVEMPQQNDVSHSNRRPVRRASSVREGHCHSRVLTVKTNDASLLGAQRLSSSSPRIDGSTSNFYIEPREELTIDDIENVYDNISYEDLKMMGLTRRRSVDGSSQELRKDTVQKGAEKTDHGSTLLERKDSWKNAHTLEHRGESYSKPSTPVNHSSHFDLKVGEENIYDTIGPPEEAQLSWKHSRSSECSKINSFLGFEADFACCDNLSRFISQDSLQLSEDDASDHQVSIQKGNLSSVDSSSNSDSLSHRSAADKLSEEVDEIWNDLENYIKKNKEKKKDCLPVAFPVSRDEVKEFVHSGSTPDLYKDTAYSSSTLSLPSNPRFTRTTNPPPYQISSRSHICEGLESLRDPSLSLSQSSLMSESAFVESSLTSASSILSTVDAENSDHALEFAEKAKSKVFMMARQYSQKIKKANQLLKISSPTPDQLPSRQQKQTHKDLAAILEENKQGGQALGARIAEYSQLYDQIMFRETSPRNQNSGKLSASEVTVKSCPSPQLNTSSHSHLDRQSMNSEDWLLHSTYSNGELSEFVSWPELDELKSLFSSTEMNMTSTQKKLVPACSVPSLKSSVHSQIPSQRWSAIISQPNKENFQQDHMYNSLGRAMVSKPQSYNRSQSSSSVMTIKSLDSTFLQGQSSTKPFKSKRTLVYDSHGDTSATASADPLLKQSEQQSDIILQDSQKVLVVPKESATKAQIATMNYFSNFKDSAEDDEDYVEIKSDGEEADEDLREKPTAHWCLESKAVNRASNEDILSSQTLSHCQNSPCTSVRSLSSRATAGHSLPVRNDTGKLNDYLWQVPSPSQQNIVQSLREKFQCLSSSSFV
ncbi:pleckstrin homology domain-containing family G member 1 isoform X2 [Protopterus annectens]|uniref:pleckstrin homology domain-containing family G member 1 isoform X2 n=1 Tax=Protopterus annectens TaxID=7888 RepID=UPI001CFB1404|nr:pleckstrin homology domain-containing family G member 1 isoform X2 [Protopterus annectens]